MLNDDSSEESDSDARKPARRGAPAAAPATAAKVAGRGAYPIAASNIGGGYATAAVGRGTAVSQAGYGGGSQGSFGGGSPHESYGTPSGRQDSYGAAPGRQDSYAGSTGRQDSYGGVGGRQDSYGGSTGRQDSYGGGQGSYAAGQGSYSAGGAHYAGGPAHGGYAGGGGYRGGGQNSGYRDGGYRDGGGGGWQDDADDSGTYSATEGPPYAGGAQSAMVMRGINESTHGGYSVDQRSLSVASHASGGSNDNVSLPGGGFRASPYNQRAVSPSSSLLSDRDSVRDGRDYVGDGGGGAAVGAVCRDGEDRGGVGGNEVARGGDTEIDQSLREEEERRRKLQIYVFVMRCIAHPFNAKQPTDMVRRQPKVTRTQLQSVRDRFTAFLAGELSISSDEAFQSAVQSYTETFLKSDLVTGLVRGGGCSANDFRDVFKNNVEKRIRSLPEIHVSLVIYVAFCLGEVLSLFLLLICTVHVM